MKDDDDTLCYRSELEAAVKAAVEAEREKFIAFLRQMHDAYAIGKPIFWAEWPNREKNT